MRYHLLLASALLSQELSTAFQMPRTRKIIAVARKSITSSPFAAPKDTPGLRSKLKSQLNIIPMLSTKSSSSKLTTKSKCDEKIPNKQILSLVTTCCLTCFLRPSMARAVVSFIDPATLTYEVPGLGIFPNGIPNLGFTEVLRYKSLASFATILVAASLISWFCVGLAFSYAFLAENQREKDDKQLSQAKRVDWKAYSQVLLGLMQFKKKKTRVETAADQKAKDEEEAMLQKANLFFQDQKYKLHHHPVHVAHSKYEQASYLDALPINEEARHDMPNGYLDTLSSAKRSTWGPYKHQLFESKARQVEKDQVEDRLQIMNNLLTWDDYKHLVGELQGRKSEVNELKQEVLHLRSLLQIEQSIHQAVPSQEAKKSTTRKDTTSDELNELGWLSQKYEDTMKESLKEHQEAQHDMGSGLK